MPPTHADSAVTPIRAAQYGAWSAGFIGLVIGAAVGPDMYQALDPEIPRLLQPVLDTYHGAFGNGAVYDVMTRTKFYAAPIGAAMGAAGLLVGGLGGLVADLIGKWKKEEDSSPR